MTIDEIIYGGQFVDSLVKRGIKVYYNFGPIGPRGGFKRSQLKEKIYEILEARLTLLTGHGGHVNLDLKLRNKENKKLFGFDICGNWDEFLKEFAVEEPRFEGRRTIENSTLEDWKRSNNLGDYAYTAFEDYFDKTLKGKKITAYIAEVNHKSNLEDNGNYTLGIRVNKDG